MQDGFFGGLIARQAGLKHEDVKKDFMAAVLPGNARAPTTFLTRAPIECGTPLRLFCYCFCA